MKNQLKMTLGSDPELFILDREKNKIVSAIPILKQNKHDPIDLKDGIKLYFDNVLAETSFPPCKTTDQAVVMIRNVLCRIQEFLGPKFSLVPKSAHTLPEDEMQDPIAQEAGCTPNFDVYKREQNPPPVFSGNLRTGSFHIHIGSEKLIDFQEKEKAIKLLDIFLGCASVLFDEDETSQVRRTLYGRAGEFRPTPYGVEYRVLGNYALRSPRLCHLVFELVDHAMSHIQRGTADDLIKSSCQYDVITAINHCDHAFAHSVLLKACLPTNLLSAVLIPSKVKENNFYEAWNI